MEPRAASMVGKHSTNQNISQASRTHLIDYFMGTKAQLIEFERLYFFILFYFSHTPPPPFPQRATLPLTGHPFKDHFVYLALHIPLVLGGIYHACAPIHTH